MTAALILAGGSVRAAQRAQWNDLLEPGQDNPAMAILDEKPLVEHVARTVRESIGGRVLIAGEVPLVDGCVAIPGGLSMVDTLLSGVNQLHADEDRLLVATADIPFLCADSVRRFLSDTPDADFVYTIVPAALCQTALPGMRRTTLQTAEGTFTGGNVVLVRPAFVRENEHRIREAYALRKDVVALAKLLGADVLLRLLVSRIFPGVLGISHLEAAVGRVVGGANVRAFIVDHHGFGSDIDRPEDLALARRLFGGV